MISGGTGFTARFLLAASPSAYRATSKKIASTQTHHSSLLIRQGKDIKRLTIVRPMNVSKNYIRHVFRAATTQSGCYRDILLAVDTETDGISLDRRAELGLPQRLSRFDIHRPEYAVIVSNECDAAGGRNTPVRKGARCWIVHTRFMVLVL